MSQSKNYLVRIFLVVTCVSLVSQQLIAENSEAEAPQVNLELTYPVGPSPKVFDSGWVFGARCIVNAGTREEKDI